MDHENEPQPESEKNKPESSEKHSQEDETLNKMKQFLDLLLKEIDKDLNTHSKNIKS